MKLEAPQYLLLLVISPSQLTFSKSLVKNSSFPSLWSTISYRNRHTEGQGHSLDRWTLMHTLMGHGPQASEIYKLDLEHRFKFSAIAFTYIPCFSNPQWLGGSSKPLKGQKKHQVERNKSMDVWLVHKGSGPSRPRTWSEGQFSWYKNSRIWGHLGHDR